MFPLKDYIGVKGYNAPASGRYINTLPGITLRNMQKVSNEEQVTFVAMWDAAQERAWMRMSTDTKLKLRARYDIKSNRGKMNIKSSLSDSTIDASEHYRGLVVCSGYDYNGFFSFYVSTIKLDLSAAYETVTIKIFDQDGAVMDTLSIEDAVIGSNTLTVNKSYVARRLFFAVDATTVALYNSELHVPYLNACYETICEVLGRDCGLDIYAAEAMIESPETTNRTGISYGLSVNLVATCDYTNIIGYRKEDFLPAWMYLCGAELMNERLFTSKKNELTTVDAETAESMRDHYTAEYENAMEDIIAGIRIDDQDSCIECRQIVSSREQLP